MTSYIGIDPGQTGAICTLSEGCKPLISDTPMTETSSGRKKQAKPAYDLSEMVRILRTYAESFSPVHVIIEAQQSFPKQGSVSNFTTGYGYGLWRMAAVCLMLPYEVVRPARWKRDMLDGRGKDKETARLRAIELFPSLAPELNLKRHHGRAEALLIAEWGRRTLGGAHG